MPTRCHPSRQEAFFGSAFGKPCVRTASQPSLLKFTDERRARGAGGSRLDLVCKRHSMCVSKSPMLSTAGCCGLSLPPPPTSDAYSLTRLTRQHPSSVATNTVHSRLACFRTKASAAIHIVPAEFRIGVTKRGRIVPHQRLPRAYIDWQCALAHQKA